MIEIRITLDDDCIVDYEIEGEISSYDLIKVLTTVVNAEVDALEHFEEDEEEDNGGISFRNIVGE